MRQRCQFARDNKRCHDDAETRITFGPVPLLKVCWSHADLMMQELRDMHAAAGHRDEALKGYAAFVEDMERQKRAQRAGLN